MSSRPGEVLSRAAKRAEHATESSPKAVRDARSERDG